jgi:hypothetical protein
VVLLMPCEHITSFVLLLLLQQHRRQRVLCCPARAVLRMSCAGARKPAPDRTRCPCAAASPPPQAALLWGQHAPDAGSSGPAGAAAGARKPSAAAAAQLAGLTASPLATTHAVHLGVCLASIALCLLARALAGQQSYVLNIRCWLSFKTRLLFALGLGLGLTPATCRLCPTLHSHRLLVASLAAAASRLSLRSYAAGSLAGVAVAALADAALAAEAAACARDAAAPCVAAAVWARLRAGAADPPAFAASLLAAARGSSGVVLYVVDTLLPGLLLLLWESQARASFADRQQRGQQRRAWRARRAAGAGLAGGFGEGAGRLSSTDSGSERNSGDDGGVGGAAEQPAARSAAAAAGPSAAAAAAAPPPLHELPAAAAALVYRSPLVRDQLCVKVATPQPDGGARARVCGRCGRRDAKGQCFVCVCVPVCVCVRGWLALRALRPLVQPWCQRAPVRPRLAALCLAHSRCCAVPCVPAAPGRARPARH